MKPFFFITTNEYKKIFNDKLNEKGLPLNHHGLYVKGYVCTTVSITIRNNLLIVRKSTKILIIELFSEIRKYEIGIASNLLSARTGEVFLNFVLTARQVTKVRLFKKGKVI